jgi:hypothetical protein
MRVTGRSPICCSARTDKNLHAAVDLGGTACKMPSCSDDSLIFSLVVGSLGQMTRPLESSRLASCRVTSMTPHWLQ